MTTVDQADEAANKALPVFYFEDFRPGQIATSGLVTITEADIIRFATEFDALNYSCHVDYLRVGNCAPRL